MFKFIPNVTLLTSGTDEHSGLVPVIPALRTLRQDPKFEASLGHSEFPVLKKEVRPLEGDLVKRALSSWTGTL
jgi:hypothetical protein